MDLVVLQALAAAYGCRTVSHVDMAKHTTFRIGGKAELGVAVPQKAESLSKLLRYCQDNDIPFTMLGRGSNLLVPDAGYPGVVFQFAAERPRVRGNCIRCSAGTPLSVLCRIARDAGLSGLEFAAGIPGTVGGAVFMNAGAFGSDMASAVLRVNVASPEGAYDMPLPMLQFGYRRSLFMDMRNTAITSVIFRLTQGDTFEIATRMKKYTEHRRKSQPLEWPSAGSYFKRPEGRYAGALIEQFGLKGFRIGDAQVSEKHAGFIVNRGNATCDDVLKLEEYVSQVVMEQSGVQLEREVQLLTP